MSPLALCLPGIYTIKNWTRQKPPYVRVRQGVFRSLQYATLLDPRNPAKPLNCDFMIGNYTDIDISLSIYCTGDYLMQLCQQRVDGQMTKPL